MHTACECNTIFFSCVHAEVTLGNICVLHALLFVFFFFFAVVDSLTQLTNCIHRTKIFQLDICMCISMEKKEHMQKKCSLLAYYFCVPETHIYIFFKITHFFSFVKKHERRGKKFASRKKCWSTQCSVFTHHKEKKM